MEPQRLKEYYPRYKGFIDKAIEEIVGIDVYAIEEGGSIMKEITPKEREDLISLISQSRLILARDRLKTYHSERSTRASRYLLDAVNTAVTYFNKTHES